MDLDFNASDRLVTFGRQSIDADDSDLKMLVRGELETTKAMVDRASSRTRDSMTRLHLRDLSARINDILDGDDD